MKKNLVKILSLVLVLVVAISCVVAFTACDKKVKVNAGAQVGTTGFLYLKGDSEMMFPGFKGYVNPKSYDNIALAAEAMINGNLDFVVADVSPAKALANKNNNVKVIDIALSTEEYAMGVDKSQPEVQAAVNEVITTLGLDFIKELAAKYEDENYVPTADELFDAGTKDESKKDKQLVVATESGFKPFDCKQGEKFYGVDFYIANLVAQKLNLELVIEDMSFDAVVSSVGKNGVDIACAGLTVTKSRKQVVNFSDSYFKGSYQVVVVNATNTVFDSCTTADEVVAVIKSLNDNK